MPRYFLLQNGINPERDFAKFSFSGAHDATALWVESGKVDAGALNEAVWEKLVQTKKVDTGKVKVFWTTPPYIDYVWTVRGDLDSSVVEKIEDRRSIHQAELQQPVGSQQTVFQSEG